MKNILITGVSTGIGYDAVAYFTALGYRIFGSVRKVEDQLRLEKEFPDNFIALTFDVTKPEQVENARQQVEEILAGESLLALVNNAGFAQGGPMALLSDILFRQQIEANVFGVRNVTNAFLPLLGASKNFTGQPGKIINISSISGVFNTPMNGAYCVSKHALESMAEVYRRELRMYGIQVSSIQPGPIQSKLWDKNVDKLDEYYATDYAIMARKANRIALAAQRNALPARVISELIHKIIEHKKPKLTYMVSKNLWANILLTKFTPKRVVDLILERYLNR
jgi:NAD(P)-dependent dehydrogenase (short-subunit alcohol dehydrogenase family)